MMVMMMVVVVMVVMHTRTILPKVQFVEGEIGVDVKP